MLKRLKKQGFTLVELLVTIVLLGIVAAIVIYNMTNVANDTKETDYERYIAAVKSAADVYATNNPEAFNDLYVSKSYVYLTIGDLVRSGLLDENLQNPYTGEKVDFNEKIKANLDTTSGDIKFEYPLEKGEEETFLVTISDYVVWGEGYDCMQGAGSYQLSLSDEDGNLIMLNDQETINKYNFKCSLPSGFDPTIEGNYEIEYTWITESGTKKSATRTLRVLPKVRPTFRTNYDYDFNQNPWFTPGLLGSGEEQDKNCPTGWRCLTYTPYVEGADPESTTLKITKIGNNPKTNEQNVTNGFISTYETYRVDDGDKTYKIQTTVVGHYNKNYSYTAEGSERIRMKLIIPPSYVKPENKNWVTQKKFEITDPYSPVGLEKYEFKLIPNGETPSNDLEMNKTNIFNRTGNPTPKVVDLLGGGTCTNREITYPKIAFRAINKEGYVGDWVETESNLTNMISKLITGTSEGCTSPSKCCYKSGSSCYYNEPIMNISYGGKKFIVLEKLPNGEIITSYEGVNQYPFSPTTSTPGSWSIQTCDGIFTANYKISTPALNRIVLEGTRFADSVLPKNYTSVLRNTTWYTGTGGSYTSYIGNVNASMVSKYGKALYDSHRYWTTETYRGPGRKVIADSPHYHAGENTTVYDSYFKTVYNGQIVSAYGANSLYIKPLAQFKNTLYACSGNGTSNNPYVIAT